MLVHTKSFLLIVILWSCNLECISVSLFFIWDNLAPLKLYRFTTRKVDSSVSSGYEDDEDDDFYEDETLEEEEEDVVSVIESSVTEPIVTEPQSENFSRIEVHITNKYTLYSRLTPTHSHIFTIFFSVIFTLPYYWIFAMLRF